MWPLLSSMWRSFRSLLLILILVSLVEATLTHDRHQRRHATHTQDPSTHGHRAARLSSTNSPSPTPSRDLVEELEVAVEEDEVGEEEEVEEEGYSYSNSQPEEYEDTEEEGEEELIAEDERNCTQCAFREEVKRLRIEAIKVQILSKLRMERPPNISNPTVPAMRRFDTIMENYEMQGTEPARGHQYRSDYDDYHSKSLEVFAFPTTRE